jgi:hypothetical protein
MDVARSGSDTVDAQEARHRGSGKLGVMASAKAAPKAKKDALDRELTAIGNVLECPATSEPLDPANAEARLRTGWTARAPMFEASLPTASEEGRARFGQARSFFEAGMPRGVRDVDEQGAFFAIAGQANVPDAPRWPDFYERWIEDGGLAYAIEIASRAPATQQRIEGMRTEVVLLPGTTDAYACWVLSALIVKIDALDAAGRAALIAKVAPLAHTSTPEAAAAIAIALDDETVAKQAIALADAAEHQFRHPWPTRLFSVLRDGDAFAHLLSRGAAAFQFYGAGEVLFARGRVPDPGRADALVRFFAAAMAEPRRMQETYVKKFAAVACTIADARLAWLFTEHHEHAWFEKHAPFYSARHPDVRPKRPGDEALAARMVPEPPAPRPAGFTKAELDALPEDAREERLLGQLQFGHLGTAFALTLLAEYPTPRVAAAIFEKMEQRDFATQMPKPGFHKELKEDLRALAGKHPALREAIASAKKAAKSR